MWMIILQQVFISQHQAATIQFAVMHSLHVLNCQKIAKILKIEYQTPTLYKDGLQL